MDPDRYAGFLRAVLESPEDDAPRLVLADALEEAGDGDRADFIRVQVALARLPAPLEVDWVNGRCSVCGEEETLSSHYHCTVCGDLTSGMGCGKEACRRQQERLADLRRREAELFTWHNIERWFSHGPWLRTCIEPADFDRTEVFSMLVRRGFVTEIKCAAADWLAHGPAVVRAQPVARVTLSDKRPGQGSFDYFASTVPADLRGKPFWIWDAPRENAFGSSLLPWEIYGWLEGSLSPWHKQYPTEAAALPAPAGAPADATELADGPWRRRE